MAGGAACRAFSTRGRSRRSTPAACAATAWTSPGRETPRGFRWRIDFESVRREATVFLNGRRIGRNTDPYTPFEVDARGLRPGRSNRLVVVVDSRKNPDLPEGWWNWGGIVRPVRLEPVGRAHVRDLGTMSQVRCRGPARRCRASLLLDGVLERFGKRAIDRLVSRCGCARPADARSQGPSGSAG